jgi:hypothetical protein
VLSGSHVAVHAAAAHVAHVAAPAVNVILPVQPVPPGVGLSPPWYTFASEMKATIGATPGVHVSDLKANPDGSYTLDITAKSFLKAVEVASIVKPTADFGGTTVTVVVSDKNGDVVNPIVPTSVYQVEKLYNGALKGNDLYAGVKAKPLFPNAPVVVFPIFTPTVVQFYNDNLADYYSNANLVAADAFGDVLDPQLGGHDIAPSTAPIKHVQV